MGKEREKREQALSSAQAQIEVLKRLRQGSAAYLLGLSIQTIRTTANIPRNSDGTYDGAALHKWDLDRKVGEDMLNGADSPALERYRLARAIEAERRNQIEEGRLLLRDQVQAELAEIARIFQQEAEAIERTHGKAIGDDIRRMIDRAEQAWRARVTRDAEPAEVQSE